MQVSHLILLFALLQAASAVPLLDTVQQIKRNNVVVTATINGKAATWTQAAVPWNGGNNQDSTTTRTHKVTKTVKKSKHKREEPTPEPTHHYHKKRQVILATIYGKVVSWTTGDAPAPAATNPPKPDPKPAPNNSPKPAPKSDPKPAPKPDPKPSPDNSKIVSKNLSPGGSSGGSSGVSGDLKSFSAPGKFQDGKIKCSDFPSGNGVIKVDWVGLNGWSSIQQTKEGGSTSKTCSEGLLCSYACQAGMSKTQWPSNQPANGESRGGLLCKNGYLYRTNTKSDTLCEWGKQTANAVSKLDKVVSLCRTDYPGSENMNIPTSLKGGLKMPISVVNEDTYYNWKGGKTSTQYYVNNAGVDVEKGCVWGTSLGTVGNWAPVVLGAGYTDGKTWLSIRPNPNNKKAPNYNLKIEAANGGQISGTCKYENGKISGGSDGCTVAVTSGSANFVFY